MFVITVASHTHCAFIYLSSVGTLTTVSLSNHVIELSTEIGNMVHSDPTSVKTFIVYVAKYGDVCTETKPNALCLAISEKVYADYRIYPIKRRTSETEN